MSVVFWPNQEKHLLENMPLRMPDHWPSDLKSALSNVLKLSGAVRSLERSCLEGTAVVENIKAAIAKNLVMAAQQLSDQQSALGLKLNANNIIDAPSRVSAGPEQAGLDESELVSYVGPLSTWLGKSKKLFFSAFFGRPNFTLQNVSNVVDLYFHETIGELSDTLLVELKILPNCSYKIIDLIGIAGEADTFPKHFAYFMPEDQGVKYSPVKRTVVFANTYKALYKKISFQQRESFGWHEADLPLDQDIGRYLIGWFRGHDLGHSVVTNNTDYKALSKHDRWGSMVAQEAVADVFGYLLASSHLVATALDLDIQKLGRLYVLELFRYLRRGPTLFPDAGSAYIQLKLLEETGALRTLSGSRIEVDIEALHIAMHGIARKLISYVLSGDVIQFEAFLANYSPHRIDDGRDLLFGLQPSHSALVYEQSTLEACDGVL